MGAVLSGAVLSSWFLPPADAQPRPKTRRSSVLRQGPTPLASTYGEGARAANLEKPWVRRLLCYAACLLVCLAPLISVIALVGWGLTMEADALEDRINLDLGIEVSDECDTSARAESSSGDAEVLTQSENKLEAAVSTNFTTFAILVGTYFVLHCKEPKRFYRNPLKRGFGPPRPAGAFGWLGVVARMPLDEVERHVGSDGRALLEFISLGLRIMSSYAAFGVLALVTYVATSQIASSQPDWVDPGFLESASLLGSLVHGQHLASGWHASSLYAAIWFSVLCNYALAALTLWLLRRSWLRMIDAQQRRMRTTDDASLRTVLVRTTAPQYHSEAVRLWEDAYPGAVDTVRVVRDSRQLPQLLARAFTLAREAQSIEAQQAQLEQELAATRAASGSKGRPCQRAAITLMVEAAHVHRPKLPAPAPLQAALPEEHEADEGGAGTRESREADARAKLEVRLASTLAEHEEAVASAERELVAIDVPDNDRGVFSFVCFRTRSTAHFAQQVMTSVAVHKAWPAPADTDVNWAALYPEAARKTLAARATVTASYYAMLCFYSVPIAFVSSLIALEKLQKSLPFLKVLLCLLSETARSFITAFLPQLALKLFLAILPTICTRMAWLRGSPNLARIEVDAILNLWLFQFVWVLFGTAAVNGIVTERSYKALVATMGDTSVFLMIYINLQATLAMPLSLLTRAPQIAMEILSRRVRKPDVVRPEPLPFQTIWTSVLLSTAVGIIYSVAYPVIVIFVVHHLGVSYLLVGRSLLFSNSRGWIAGKVDGGKALVWADASKWLLILLCVGQAFVAGAHLAEDQWLSAVCLIPLFPLNFFAHRHFCRHFKPKLQYLSIAGCNQLDDAERVLDKSVLAKRLTEVFGPSAFVQPDMRAETWARLREGKTAPARPGDPPAEPPRLRIAVVGASGGVGRHVVKLALAEKHTVVALARDPSEVVPRKARRLKKFKVDLAQCDVQELASLLKGCNFVISCLGNRRGEDKVVQRGTRTLLAAMAAVGVTRMAMLSCVGVSDSGQQLRQQGWMGWVYSAMFSTVLLGEMEDLTAAEGECRGQRKGPGVACVVVRASDLSDASGVGKFVLAPAGGVVGATVTREDVATFLLSLVKDHRYDGKAVSIGGPLPPGVKPSHDEDWLGALELPAEADLERGIEPEEEQAALAAAGDAAPEEGLRGLVGAAQGFIGGIFRQGSKGGLGAATSSSAEEVDPRAGQREWLEQQAGAHEAADTDLAGAAAPPMKLGYHGRGREVFFADYGFR